MCSYREAMREFANMSNLEVWYSHLDMAGIVATVGLRSQQQRARGHFRRPPPRRNRRISSRLGTKLTEVVDGELRFRSDPPLLVRVSELYGDSGRWADPAT